MSENESKNMTALESELKDDFFFLKNKGDSRTKSENVKSQFRKKMIEIIFKSFTLNR